MQQPTLRKDPMYPGKVTDEAICAIFEGAGDFVRREILCNGHKLYAYMIDGLVSGSQASDYIFKPISMNLRGDKLEKLYQQALFGAVYNSVASSCKDLDDISRKLVNGFCVVLFPQIGAVAYEVKTGEKRGVSGPEVENTVKGPKDAFTETVRTNTNGGP